METAASFEARSAPSLYPTTGKEKANPSWPRFNAGSITVRASEVGAWLRKAMLGYYQYHAVPGNSTQLRIFQRRVAWLWRSILVRRSQRARVRWDRLSPLLARWIPQPRIL